MVQGDTFLEGISLRDESYDGKGSKWDRKVDLISTSNSGSDKENVVNIFHQIESFDFDLSGGMNSNNGSSGSSTGGDGSDASTNTNTNSNSPNGLNTNTNNNFLLTGGLGQLTDKIEGANSFTMDIGYGLGKFSPLSFFYFLPLFELFVTIDMGSFNQSQGTWKKFRMMESDITQN